MLPSTHIHRAVAQAPDSIMVVVIISLLPPVVLILHLVRREELGEAPRADHGVDVEREDHWEEEEWEANLVEDREGGKRDVRRQCLVCQDCVKTV